MFLLLVRSTGVPPKALKKNPKGGLNNDFLPIKLIITPCEKRVKIAKGKSQFEVCGPAITKYLLRSFGNPFTTFQPKTLKRMNLEILCIAII